MHLIQSPRPTDGSADSSHCCIPSRPTATAGCFVLLSSSWLVCRSSPFLSLQQSWLAPGLCSIMGLEEWQVWSRSSGPVGELSPWPLTVCFSPITFFCDREIIIDRVFGKNPRNSSSCVGVNTLLLVLTINPRPISVWRTVARCCFSISFDWAINVQHIVEIDNYAYAQLVKGTHHWFQEFGEYVWGTAEFPWLAIPPEVEEFSVVGCNWDSQVSILGVQLH